MKDKFDLIYILNEICISLFVATLLLLLTAICSLGILNYVVNLT